MLRVIGGELKRKKLHTIKGLNIRPTADRVREAIFNIIAHQVKGQKVLELFAGTGALSIEALSRGAEKALLVDKSRQAVAVIRRNIRVCGLEHRAMVVQRDVRLTLSHLPAPSDFFDLVFMDPPYSRGLIMPAFENLRQSDKLKKNALIVLEHPPEEIPSMENLGFYCHDSRCYGKTLVSFFHYVL